MRLSALAVGVLAVTLLAQAGGVAAPAQRDAGLGGCELLPVSDAFHQDVSGLPEAGNSGDVIDRILADGGDYLHPDFGSNPHYGIPYEVVGPGQKRVG